jgi:hypothetical protein
VKSLIGIEAGSSVIFIPFSLESGLEMQLSHNAGPDPVDLGSLDLKFSDILKEKCTD